MPATTAWALVKPLERPLPVFPYAFGDGYGSWTASSVGWAAAGVLAAAFLGLVLASDGRPFAVRPPFTGSPP